MSDRPIRIRRGSVADLDTIVEFNRAMAVESESKTLDLSTVTAGVRRALEDPTRSVYFLAETNGTVVGQAMVTMEWSDWRNGFFWWIQSVYVDPGSRSRGVFRAIYEHIVAIARQRRDVCGVRLYVHRDNSPAIDVYSRLGMRLTGYLLYEEDLSDVSDSPAS
jgi:GNAT superfamily N-acetyltransferase